MLLRGLGLGDIDVSDDSATMGADEDIDSLSDLSSAADTADSNALDTQVKTSLAASSSTSSSFNWTGLTNAGVGVLQSLFGKKPAPSTMSSSQLAAAAAAAQAQRTQTYLMVGGLLAAAGLGYVLLRRKSA